MSQEMKLNLDEKFKTFSARLKAAREAMHLETKEAASQLRLNERIILMLESGSIDPTLPMTFLKGYIRNYAKLVQIPEQEVKNLLEPLQAAATANSIDPHLLPPTENTITSGNYRMQFATALVALTIVGLVGTWWHTHTIHAGSQTGTTSNIAIPTADNSSPIQSKPAPISLPTPAQTSAGAEHPLVGALVQQISPPAPNSSAATTGSAPQVPAPTAENNQPTTVVAPGEKPESAAKPAARAPKTTTKQQQQDDDADDNDDDDNSSD